MATFNDREILNSIFNPLLPNGSLLFDENVPVEGSETDEEIVAEEVKFAKHFEIKAIAAADAENYTEAISLFSQSIQMAPSRASGYNNRAQTLRLMGRVEEAKDDLNNAINLSEGKGRVACQAHCQRGLIHLKEGRREDAKYDFETAAKLGSQFAKAQLVQMNPYAALCNKMLRGVFEKLQKGETSRPEDDKDGEKI